jgi:hypothetical protein
MCLEAYQERFVYIPFTVSKLVGLLSRKQFQRTTCRRGGMALDGLGWRGIKSGGGLLAVQLWIQMWMRGPLLHVGAVESAVSAE